MSSQAKKAVEENLHYLVVIKGRPDPGMSLADQMSRLHVPGVSIAVIHNQRIDWSKGYGLTRLGGPPVSTLTLFGAASMSKPVTAMAILRLVQEGKIDLDVDVNTYLKSWKIPANEFTKDHPVTVRELLSHTSGIGTHSGMIYDPDKGIPSVLEILDGKAPATRSSSSGIRAGQKVCVRQWRIPDPRAPDHRPHRQAFRRGHGRIGVGTDWNEPEHL